MFLSYPYTSDTSKKLLSEFYASKKKNTRLFIRGRLQITFLHYLRILDDDTFAHRPDKLHISVRKKKFITDTTTIAVT